jgi:hypothetical protein
MRAHTPAAFTPCLQRARYRRNARCRLRRRREVGKCEGRQSHAERNPELVALAKRLHRRKPKGGRMSLRAISADLAAQGFLNENGRPFAAASIQSMLQG